VLSWEWSKPQARGANTSQGLQEEPGETSLSGDAIQALGFDIAANVGAAGAGAAAAAEAMLAVDVATAEH